MPYDNTRRAARAVQTRRRVLDAATTLFLEQGYAATTVRAVAARAGVSSETVYKTFGSKASLLKSAYDVLLAGDDEPVAVAARPQVAAVRAATTARAAAAAYAALGAAVSTQVAPLLRVVLGARSTDPDLDAFVATVDAERLRGAAAVVTDWHARGWLRADLDPGTARDRLWVTISPTVHLLLQDRGRSPEEYERWLAETIELTLLA